MELPIINRVGDFEASLNSISSPSFISRLIPNIFELTYFIKSTRFLKWSALLLALLYAFSNLIHRIGILVFRLCKSKHNSSTPLSDHLLYDFDTDYSEDESDDGVTDDDDEDDEVCSSSYSSDEENEESTSSSFDNLIRGFEDFRAAGCSLRNRKFNICRKRSIGDIFSLSEIVNAKSVVKLWDGLGFDLDGSSINCGLDSFFTSTPATSFSSTPPSSPSYVVSTKSDSRNLGFSVWDTRMKERQPAVHAEWKPQRRSETTTATGRRVGGGVGKVYVRDEVSRDLTVGDLRKADSPLCNVSAEYDEDDDSSCTWWDADAVVVTAESIQGGKK